MASFHFRLVALLLFSATPLPCMAELQIPLAAGFNLSIHSTSSTFSFRSQPLGAKTDSNDYFFPFLATQGFFNGSSSKGMSLGMRGIPVDHQTDTFDFFLCICIGQLTITNDSSQIHNLSIKGRHDAAEIVVAIAENSFTVPVWSANAGRPLTSVNASLAMGTAKALELRDANSTVVWSVGSDVAAMELQDSGNLVILDSANRTQWQSFKSPTDTLMASQNLDVGMNLTSNESLYSLAMEPRGLVFYLIGLAGAANSSSFWIIPSPNNSTDTSIHQLSNAASAHAVLTIQDGAGFFTVFRSAKNDSEDAVVSCALSQGAAQSSYNWADLARLENDGLLHFYAVQPNNLEPVETVDSLSCTYSDGNDSVNIASRTGYWRSCGIPTACGPLGICSPVSGSPCTCPTDSNDASSAATFKLIDEHDASKGCNATGSTVPISECGSVALWDLLQIDNTATIFQMSAENSNSTIITQLEHCKSMCLSACNCTGVIFKQGESLCFPIMDPRVSLLDLTSRESSDLSYTAFLKVAHVSHSHDHRTIIIACTTSVISIIFAALVLYGCRRFIRIRGGSIKFSNNNPGADQELALILPNLPTRFSFKALHKATQGFNRLLGAGGMGSVYAGALPNGKQIAVKKININLQGEMSKAFLAEVATMGRTSHFNIVQLLGFCWETSNQMLVYEYMERGSLDQWLFKAEQFLDWATRFKVALGIAKGLAYLHEGCSQPILHLDIKPQNILLDEDFEPKLADFGLAKLMARDVSQVVTAVRGTPGYIAPEMLWSGARVSKKCDIYSLGMVLLEMVCGRKTLDLSLLMAEKSSNHDSKEPVMEEEEQWHFPSWAAKKYEEGRKLELVDRRLQGGFCAEEAGKMIEVALCCIQEKPSSRPSAGTVVQWLEGSSIPLEDAPFSNVAFTQSRIKCSIAQHLQLSHSSSRSNN